ncbi:hypothetical protein NQ318_019444 [Aromia moschata]|uniref:Fatty acyl-CoA reductase C-terminal domain-containing protein n=1 Tax=Aromia moschata TaxID=1265417 RepID=A0AAV8XKR4_9CUCU|nr:hypothetical protein NQ318_019444 [Aromia moschata]
MFLVIPSATEPTAGYVENIYSLAGLAAANALGVNRVNYFKDGTLDVVPVDFVVSLLIASGWYAGLQKIRKKRGDIANTDVLIYNCISSQEKPVTTGEWMEFTRISSRDVPSTKMIQLPLSFNTACYYNYKLLRFILHICMAYLCDTGLELMGKRPQVLEGYESFHKYQEIASKFLFKQWYFSNENAQKLLKRMSFSDRGLFNFDILTLNWESYFSSFARGIRVYILKDPMSTISEGRIKQSKKLTFQLVSAGVVVIILYVISKLLLYSVFFR